MPTQSSIAVTPGAGANVDTATTTLGNRRQVISVGDPTTDANYALVQSTDPASNAAGLVVRDVNSSAVVAKLGAGIIVTSISNTIGVNLGKVDGTIQVNVGKIDDTVAVKGTLTGITNSIAVFFDRGNPSVNIGSPTITGITNSIGVNLGKVDGTIQVDIGKINDSVAIKNGVLTSITNTVTVKIDPAGFIFTNTGSTASIFTVSGSTSGVSASGVQLVAPSANYSFKVFAMGLTTTAQSQLLVRFTNGAGTSPTEFWRYAFQAPTQGMAGANLAVTPPGFLFATGTNTTLALLLDTGSLLHYSVSFIKESA